MKLKVLAVDTSASVAAVAVMDETKLLGEYIINHKNTHSQKLMPMIGEVIKSLELSAGDIDLYAASVGPGSFTGLRIGVTTIKAIAYAEDKPVISIPTLDALAYNIPISEVYICPIMDARNNQVYTALYKWENGDQLKLSDYMGIHLDDLINIIKGKNQRTIFLGDGVKIHKDYLKSQLKEGCLFAPESIMLQKASSVAQLALNRFGENGNESCFDMVPFYLRKSQAEREYDNKMEHLNRG